MIARLNYADGHVASIEISDEPRQAGFLGGRREPPDIAIEQHSGTVFFDDWPDDGEVDLWVGQRLFRCTGDRYNGEVVYNEVER